MTANEFYRENSSGAERAPRCGRCRVLLVLAVMLLALLSVATIALVVGYTARKSEVASLLRRQAPLDRYAAQACLAMGYMPEDAEVRP